jgi:uncharacterized membrane protein YjjP (DUF1212 family)
MTGVEILATQEVATAFGFSWENFWMALMIVTIVGCFIGLLVSLANRDFECLVVGCILGAIFGVLLGIGLGVDGLPTEYETQYKVIISDEVPMNEFTERYEIIDKEGKIYTVRERD